MSERAFWIDISIIIIVVVIIFIIIIIIIVVIVIIIIIIIIINDDLLTPSLFYENSYMVHIKKQTSFSIFSFLINVLLLTKILQRWAKFLTN